MSFDSANKYEIRRRALLEAIRFCGGVAAYSRRLKVSRSRASNWRNQPEIAIPYEYVVLTEDITQVSIERLSPFTESANKVIRRLRSKDKLSSVSMEVKEIIIEEQPYPKWQNPERPIIVGTDGVLISGLMQVEIHKASNIKKIQVFVLDLEALILEKRTVEDMNIDLFISEQVAIGLRLEQLLGNHSGRRNDLPHCNSLNGLNSTEPRRICDEVRWDRGGMIAQIVGLPSRDAYYRAKQVYLSGNSELINLLDLQKISIATAARKAKSLINFHQNIFQTKLVGA